MEMEKMCGLSPAAALPAALYVGASVFILFPKRYAGGKNGNWGPLEGGGATTNALRGR